MLPDTAGSFACGFLCEPALMSHAMLQGLCSVGFAIHVHMCSVNELLRSVVSDTACCAACEPCSV